MPRCPASAALSTADVLALAPRSLSQAKAGSWPSRATSSRLAREAGQMPEAWSQRTTCVYCRVFGASSVREGSMCGLESLQSAETIPSLNSTGGNYYNRQHFWKRVERCAYVLQAERPRLELKRTNYDKRNKQVCSGVDSKRTAASAKSQRRQTKTWTDEVNAHFEVSRRRRSLRSPGRTSQVRHPQLQPLAHVEVPSACGEPVGVRRAPVLRLVVQHPLVSEDAHGGETRERQDRKVARGIKRHQESIANPRQGHADNAWPLFAAKPSRRENLAKARHLRTPATHGKGKRGKHAYFHPCA